MSQYGSASVGFILIGGYNVLGVITDIEDNVEAILENNHALGDAWFKNYPVGLSKFSLAQKGFYDDGAAGTVVAFVSANGVTRVFCWSPEPNTIGNHFVGFQGPIQTKVTRLPALATLAKLDVLFGANGALEVGQIVHALGTETTAGNSQTTPADSNNDSRTSLIPITGVSVANPGVVTTGVPHGYTTNQVVMIAGTTTTPTINGAQIVTVVDSTHFSVPVNVTNVAVGTGTARALSTVNGGAAYIQTEALTLGGYTNAAPLVKHSADNVTYSTLATFTPQTAAPAAERIAVAAGTTVHRYTASAWSYGGAGSGQSFKFMAGFARG